MKTPRPKKNQETVDTDEGNDIELPLGQVYKVQEREKMITAGVPQGSVMDLEYVKAMEITAYAEDIGVLLKGKDTELNKKANNAPRANILGSRKKDIVQIELGIEQLKLKIFSDT